jgi:hypothetical protein
MKKCIICGVKEGEIKNGHVIYIQNHKLPHGKIYLCHYDSCQKMLTCLINNEASPMVWVSKDDLSDDYANCYANCLTEEEMEKLTPEDIIEIADNATDLMYDGNSLWYLETYRENLSCAVDEWRVQKELEVVENLPAKELPLLIGNLKYQSSIDVLEKRLKEGK